MTTTTHGGPLRSGESHARNSTSVVHTVDGRQLVRDLRDFGASQGHIARIVGVSGSAVSLWESGRRRPSDEALRRLTRLHSSLISDQAAAS